LVPVYKDNIAFYSELDDQGCNLMIGGDEIMTTENKLDIHAYYPSEEIKVRSFILL